jgi:YD repeat-containing protein
VREAGAVRPPGRGSDDLASFTHGNGLVTSYQYFLQGPLQQITVSSGSGPLEDLLYGRDEVYDVESLTETLDGDTGNPLDYSYGYDGAERLKTAS